MKTFQTETFMRLLGKNTVIRTMIPLGFKPGAPAVHTENGHVLLTVPFARSKTNGDVDNTLVYPIAFTATFAVFAPAEPPASFANVVKNDKDIFPGKLVEFRSLQYTASCRDVDFAQPVGKFRHDAVKKYDKEAYAARIQALYAAYDKIVNAYLAQSEPAVSDKIALKTLLDELVVPGQKPMYKVVDEGFHNLYF